MKKMMTVGLILEGDKILLGMKKTGFGEGRWNGFGGKVKPGETIDQAVAREFKEESGIDVLRSEKFGEIDFEFRDNPEILEVHFYRILEYRGNPEESDEMRPQWFNINEIPYSIMWPDDKYWMPLFLRNKKFKGKIYFENQNTIISCNLKELKSF
ncbi:8-oxo-dGTP diphosphatase [Candidatus Pacearchaeota archaeon]|nr:8-oxo-dGTP diphosphatase [Candidatus Pacearchaeota archaeon]